MPYRTPRWIWAGRIAFALITVGLVAYLLAMGLDKADKVASGISAVLALLSLGAPYLLPAGQAAVVPAAVEVSDTGKSTAGPGGRANTGLRASASGLNGRVTVKRTGDADASAGGHANSGIELT